MPGRPPGGSSSARFDIPGAARRRSLDPTAKNCRDNCRSNGVPSYAASGVGTLGILGTETRKQIQKFLKKRRYRLLAERHCVPLTAKSACQRTNGDLARL